MQRRRIDFEFDPNQSNASIWQSLRNGAEEYEQTQYDNINLTLDVNIRKFWKFLNKSKYIDSDLRIIKDEMTTYSTPETQMFMRIEHLMTLLNSDFGVNCNNGYYKEQHKRFIDANVEQIRLQTDHVMLFICRHLLLMR